MSQITILKETAPTRCEICHQADCYDPVNNYCSRCSSITPPFNNEPVINQKVASPQTNYQPIRPSLVELTDFGANYLINYQWSPQGNAQGFLFALMLLPPILIKLFFNTYILGPFTNPMLGLILVIYLLAIAAVHINKTQINISSTKLIKTSGPIALFSNKEIALTDIQEVYYERHKAADKLIVKLNSGELIKLIKDMNDPESIKFIEKTIKEKVKHLNTR